MSGLTFVSEDDCFIDVDSDAWFQLIENRGGCRCFISPPCSACSEPITEEELNRVGYTYQSLENLSKDVSK